VVDFSVEIPKVSYAINSGVMNVAPPTITLIPPCEGVTFSETLTVPNNPGNPRFVDFDTTDPAGPFLIESTSTRDVGLHKMTYEASLLGLPAKEFAFELEVSDASCTTTALDWRQNTVADITLDVYDPPQVITFSV